MWSSHCSLLCYVQNVGLLKIHCLVSVRLKLDRSASLSQKAMVLVTVKTSLSGRFHPFTGHEGPQGEYRYSSTLFQTSALEGGEGSALRPGSTLPPGKTWYPLYRRLGGPQGRSGLVRKISLHRDSIPGPSSPQAVAIPTALPGPRRHFLPPLKHKFDDKNDAFCLLQCVKFVLI